jgi:hypothetical protein
LVDRPKATVASTSVWWLWGIALAAFFLAGLGAHALLGPVLTYPARYALVALFGLLVGTTELVSRYRDRPTAPLRTLPGAIYIATNALASVAALWVLQRQGVAFTFGEALPPELGQVLLAGFGTMLFFRSALFTVRVGDTDVSIGPAAVLQIIMTAADRACDRLRAGPRSDRVFRIMRGVSFERARQALPLHCFALMQNVSTAEQTQLLQNLDALAAKSMTDEVKAYNLGLLMMNVVGEDVLERAVQVLGHLILGPPTDDPPILAQASALTLDQCMALADICVALDPLSRNQEGEKVRTELEALVQPIADPAVKTIAILTRLRTLFGATTVSRALVLLTAARKAAAETSKEPLTAADLEPSPPQ